MTEDLPIVKSIKMVRGPDIQIDELGGNCPVQGTGQIDNYGFYFRARGSYWHMEIYCGPEGTWEYGEDYGTDYDAGWMTQDEAVAFIQKAAELFHERAKGTDI